MPLLPFYIASAVAAVGLLFVLRPGRKTWRRGGAILALAGSGLFISEALRLAGPPSGGVPIPLLVALAGIGLYAAVRVITHPRPVFAALYFIVTVISSAVIFLLLQAEFMAFALIIVYAGAILITYMFVLMLADQGPREAIGHLDEDDYDKIPREPLAAVLVGFILLATLASVVERVPSTSVLAESYLDQKVAKQQAEALVMMPKRLMEFVKRVDPAAVTVTVAPNAGIQGSVVQAQVTNADGTTKTIPIDAAGKIDNTQMVGLDLVARYPASLELAGVILLMAMFGAVVLARRQIEFGEDSARDAAGLRRIVLDVPDHERAAPGGGA
ncbi:MAG: NADH-quinone oxidoreductase subunit J [Planctomycetes bacterium]|nr:NADH-quinone oxidoreductase subunit J [Planctomycetota bacterium]